MMGNIIATVLIVLVAVVALYFGVSSFFGGDEPSAKEQEMQQMLERSRRY